MHSKLGLGGLLVRCVRLTACQKCVSAIKWGQLVTDVKRLAIQPLHVHLRSCSLQMTCFVTDERVRQGQGQLAVVCDLTWPNPQHTTARHLHGCTDLHSEVPCQTLHSDCGPSQS
jgi:hypothetical protein